MIPAFRDHKYEASLGYSSKTLFNLKKKKKKGDGSRKEKGKRKGKKKTYVYFEIFIMNL